MNPRSCLTAAPLPRRCVSTDAKTARIGNEQCGRSRGGLTECSYAVCGDLLRSGTEGATRAKRSRDAPLRMRMHFLTMAFRCVLYHKVKKLQPASALLYEIQSYDP
jgi:hypothetical protein